jgi:hypothetical protein
VKEKVSVSKRKNGMKVNWKLTVSSIICLSKTVIIRKKEPRRREQKINVSETRIKKEKKQKLFFERKKKMFVERGKVADKIKGTPPDQQSFCIVFLS